MKSILLFLPFLLFFVMTGNSQVRKSLQKDNLRFNYTSFITKAQNYSNLTADEKMLAAEIAYKLHLDSYALQLISELEIERNTSARLNVLKRNIEQKMTGELTFDPKYQVKFLFGEPLSDEFLSIVNKDSSLWFSSNFENFSIIQKTDIRTNLDFIQLFNGKVKNGTVTDITKIKSDKYNCGPISRVGKNYLLTSNYEKGIERTNLKLTLVNESMQTISEFPFNDKSYSVGHASYDSINQIVYFVSDMPSGNGETDIWKVRFNENTWGIPEKLSNKINTPGNEMFPNVDYPFLYFASDGHPGFGNLDIYRIHLEENSEIFHYNSPINTEFDDYALIWLDETNGYLTSRRKTGKDDDIFIISKNDWKFNCKRECDNSACVQFVVEEYLSIQPNRFEFIWDLAGDTTLSGISISHCFPLTGSYDISLSVKDLLTGEVIKDAMTKTIEIKGRIKNLPRFSVTTPVYADSLILVTDESEIETAQITQEVWEFSDGAISQSPKFEHRFKEPGFHSITRHVKIGTDSCCYQSFYAVFEVQSAASSQNEKGDGITSNDLSNYQTTIVFINADGSSAKNVTLKIKEEVLTTGQYTSLNDSIDHYFEHLKNYIVEATNDKGETITVSHSSENKTEEEFKRLVIQFGASTPSKIIHVMDEKGQQLSDVKIKKSEIALGTSDFNGNYNLDLQTKPDDFYFSKVGYWLKKVPISHSELSKKDTLFVILRKINLGDTIRLENINFDLNKDNILPDAAKILNELVVTLSENPGLKIKLEAHTDARGSDAYNLDLSKRRAKSSIEFVINQGIARNRITSEGKGENELKNKCKNGVVCDDKLHEENRRVEVIIVEYE